MRLKLLIISFLSVLCLISLGRPAAAQFNPVGQPCQLSAASNSPTCQQNQSQNGSQVNPGLHIIQIATNIIAIVAGIGAVIMVIIGGISFVTAGGATPGQRSGDPNRIKSARATIVNALIGLVIIALAWAIVTFATNLFVKT